jgi:hypothetical protein
MNDVTTLDLLMVVYGHYFRQHNDNMMPDDKPASFPNLYYFNNAKSEITYKQMVTANYSISKSKYPFIKIDKNFNDTNDLSARTFLFFPRIFESIGGEEAIRTFVQEHIPFIQPHI